MALSLSQVVALAVLIFFVSWVTRVLFIAPRSASLRLLPGPPRRGLFGGHMAQVILPHLAERTHEEWVRAYGMNLRFHGLGSFDSRLFTVDPVAISYILNHPETFSKPWQTRAFFERLVGPVVFTAEGHDHKRLRKATAPAFTSQHVRALSYIFLNKADQLCDQWDSMCTASGTTQPMTLDVLSWCTRATFDVIGLAGFDYDFNAIEGESNELYLAYRTMHTIALDSPGLGGLLEIYFPWLVKLLPTERNRQTRQAQEVIQRFGTRIVQDRLSNHATYGRDILSLLVKANATAHPSARISDEELVSSISNFMLVGTDPTSLALCWTLYLLSSDQTIQSRLRKEVISFLLGQSSSDRPVGDEQEHAHLDRLYTIESLPYLDKVIKESLRLCPPIHSTIRVASQDELIPTSASGVRLQGDPVDVHRSEFKITEGSFIHIPIAGLNTNTSVWGPDALDFNPDRWDNLPDAVRLQAGVAGLLSFSAGPRICQGTKFALTEIKTFLATMVPRFVFSPAARIAKSNMVFLRPYVRNQFSKGAKLPLIVERYEESQL